ncbi:enoyl-CoA hydratase/isomerase family protein [Pseudorhodoferax soli]|uniref:Enoyl-CoA hydratase/carnithine racemase n=1 Tax=Pseudorhodoferax soli TaxID=545864 RepID=A0A368XKU3_9BURK|nr:enoyl-CoA hydratase/isomerase family protein [Pseudorhodoferax soli]RCW68583.1 enoyl-CoA hydratase/carnithine racemase [Pseudorhodoferax soli]
MSFERVDDLSSEELEAARCGDVWALTLSRPTKLNALNASIVDSLIRAVQEINACRPKVLVLQGAGRSFCAGFDLGDIEEQSDGDLLLRFVRIETLLQAVAQSPALTVALAQGKVYGAGVDLVAVCRQRCIVADATFRMPGLKFGVVLGTRRFGEIVGREQARSVLERVESFDAATAVRMGFAHRIISEPERESVIASAIQTASILDDQARAELYGVLSPLHGDADLAALARSAASPGLKERLVRYAQGR